jgi:hypothetical protein
VFLCVGVWGIIWVYVERRWLLESHLSDERLVFQAFIAGVVTAYCMLQVRQDEHGACEDAYPRTYCRETVCLTKARVSGFHGRRRYSVLIMSVSETVGRSPACSRSEKMDTVQVRMRIHKHVELCRVAH